MPKLIYLASPYSHDDSDVRERRFNEVCRVAAKLMKGGEFVYSPIAHTHPIAQFGLPGDWSYWEVFDTLMLSKCDRMFVLMIDGWFESKGVQAEIRIAEKRGIPIKYIKELF
ncbi:MAG: DUF1937 family protein [FCB group bacterium]|nr:DUF1937 family protein [FCB group bacterium]